MDQHPGNGRRGMARLGLAGAAVLAAGGAAGQHSGGDLSQQSPTVVEVDLGYANGALVFVPPLLRFKAGRLYRMILRNRSPHTHYFTSEAFAAAVWTRKAQVMGRDAEGRNRVMAAFKGAIREIEVYPGFSAEWWFVPVQAGRFSDLRCGIKAEDGRTHAEHGMRGEIVVE